MKFIFALLFLVLFIEGCVTVPPSETPPAPVATPTPTPAPTPEENVAPLDWEKNHPERKPWSVGLKELLETSFDHLDKAKDANFFCAKYSSLTHDQKIQVWESLFVWDSYYESGWDQGNASVDVGQASDRNTYSIGLMQMSVTDQESYNIKLGYNYDQLLEPLRNLKLAVLIMAKQIDDRGKILIPKGEPGVYWATLSPNRRDDQSANIASHTKALSFCK